MVRSREAWAAGYGGGVFRGEGGGEIGGMKMGGPGEVRSQTGGEGVGWDVGRLLVWVSLRGPDGISFGFWVWVGKV
jgi:hypothetical protein